MFPCSINKSDKYQTYDGDITSYELIYSAPDIRNMEPMQALADLQFRKDDDHIEAELEKQETYDSLKWAHSYT